MVTSANEHELSGRNQSQRQCIAFAGSRCIVSGALGDVALKVKEFVDQGKWNTVLVFDSTTSELIEVDTRGTTEEVQERYTVLFKEVMEAIEEDRTEKDKKRASVGRPKLGVVAREVTLLPRHWEWLASQPGGASVALRKLVEEARHANAEKDQIRRSQDAAVKFMSALAGNEPGFEEAVRALYADNRERFNALVESWPTDVRNHTKQLAASAFQKGSSFAPPSRV